MEWPEHAGDALTVIDMSLTIQTHEDGLRSLRAIAHTDTGRQLLAALPPSTP